MTSFMMPFVYNGKPWISNDVIVCSSLLSLHAVYINSLSVIALPESF